MSQVSIVLPTHNASSYLSLLLNRLKEQTISYELIIIDSDSDSATQQIFERENVNVVRIEKSKFNHGTTRNFGLKLAKNDTVIFLTQDALPVSSDSLENLVNVLYSRDDIAMAYGRQIPYKEAGVFACFARIANYPAHSLVKTKDMIPKLGIRTCSCSNSFAVYRKKELLEVGGFPEDTILGEDVSVAARLILNGKALAYCAEAQVYHSHDYTLLEEFRRYFDIGVFHYEQREVLAEFTKAESEGMKYVLEEWRYLKNMGKTILIPAQITRTLAKYAGYRLGGWEQYLPLMLKRSLSMHRSFWEKEF